MSASGRSLTGCWYKSTKNCPTLRASVTRKSHETIGRVQRPARTTSSPRSSRVGGWVGALVFEWGTTSGLHTCLSILSLMGTHTYKPFCCQSRPTCVLQHTRTHTHTHTHTQTHTNTHAHIQGSSARDWFVLKQMLRRWRSNSSFV